MTPLKNKFYDMELEQNLMELVKLEYAMKKHFVYIDNIDELRHKEPVIRDFDHAIRRVGMLIMKCRNFRNGLN